MQNYIKGVTYLEQNLTNGAILKMDDYKRLKIEPTHPSYIDQSENFDQARFKYPYLPLHLGEFNIDIPEDYDINVLRLLLHDPNFETNEKIYLPKELDIFKDFILQNINYHKQFYTSNKKPFIYITVRSTKDSCYYNNSRTWHIDGFQGSRIDRHLIEQDIIWSNKNPTEFLNQPMFVENLNPTKHDINSYFDKNANENYAYKGKENNMYLITPYNIHRVSNDPFEGNRVFVRLTFSPVEIEDYTNTNNPMLPREYSSRRDVRDFLWEYKNDEICENGFGKL